MRVIGTAGHVDHGKSSLVEALSGTHPDRLKEEREREMTIDLGFAWLTLPGGEELGIIDVPGHRDFIENMLAGVGGIDAVLFVVAADEGVMPQTREHLAILDLLQVSAGIIALTKVDLVEDGDWLDLVELDVRQALSGTVLANAPLIHTSARTRQGLPELLAAIQEILAQTPLRPDFSRPRLPIDRVFTVAGFGSVATGTLIDGRLQVGDEIELLPKGLLGRVRGLQTHKRKEEYAIPGSRTAVNISGIAFEQIQRGDVIAHPATFQASRRLDVHFRLLPDSSGPVRHNSEVKLFLGAAETLARVRLLGSDELQPGHSAWLQLELDQPLVAIRGDRYILRRPSPGETLGGGTVVDPHPSGRHKRFAAEVLARLEALAQGTPEEILLQALLALGFCSLKEAGERANLNPTVTEAAAEQLLKQGLLLNLSAPSVGLPPPPRLGDLITHRGLWQRLSDQIVNAIGAYHQAYPLRQGLPREELKSRLKELPRVGTNRVFNWLVSRLAQENHLVEQGPLLLLPGHQVRFTASQQALVDSLLQRFAANPYNTPSPKECVAVVSPEVYQALLDGGHLVQVSAEVVFRQEDYAQLVRGVKEMITRQGSLTAAQVRDHFNTSRKYALALLEYLDSIGITTRQGDERKLKSPSSANTLS